jgi:hypothetical protein
MFMQVKGSPSDSVRRGDESDRYEELLVNPALLVLARQRGNIDCGGLRYLIVGYGHFRQLVVPAATGNVSVAFELASSPADRLQAIRGVAARHERPA